MKSHYFLKFNLKWAGPPTLFLDIQKENLEVLSEGQIIVAVSLA